MANQQGTGKHPHKSAAEPYPHTKDNAQNKSQSHGRAHEQHGSKDRKH